MKKQFTASLCSGAGSAGPSLAVTVHSDRPIILSAPSGEFAEPRELTDPQRKKIDELRQRYQSRL
jgi:hypothetical protein